MRHLLMPQTKVQAEEFLRLAEVEAAKFGVSHTPPQDAEEFIHKNWCEFASAKHERFIPESAFRDWMTGHVRVPVEVLEAAASALIPLSNAAMPIEREGLTDEHNEAAYSALGKLAPYLSGSKDWSWLTASKGE